MVHGRLGLGTENGDGDGGVGRLAVQCPLLCLQLLEGGLFGVDLVLHAEQATDRTRVREQRAELGDGGLVGGHLAVHVRHLLGLVLRLLGERQLRAEDAVQLTESGRVNRDRNLDGDRRGSSRAGRGALLGNVTTRLLRDLGGAGRGLAHARRPDRQLGGVDDRRRRHQLSRRRARRRRRLGARKAPARKAPGACWRVGDGA